MIRYTAFLLVVVFLSIPAPRASAQANDCTDPYWMNTLRCKASPTTLPHATLGGPTAVGQLKTFTRVFLTNPSVRCADGTTPAIYVDPAVVPSNKWLISMTGGGSCNPTDSNGDGIVDAQGCYEDYAVDLEAKEMGTGDEPPMKELTGINRPGSLENPIFSAYNRVRVEKCSFDRYNGRADWTDLSATSTIGDDLEFDLFQHGYLIMQEVLSTLRPGLSYTTWIDSGVVTPMTEMLPPLEDAEVVLFAGHSGGAHGLMQNIDSLAETLDGWAAFAGDVRALFDAHYVVSLESEAAFSRSTCAPGPVQGDAYDDIWAGCSKLDGGAILNDYDGETYYTDSDYQVQYDTWQAELDASCLATHTASEDWKCRDVMHVLLNHVTTPFFFRQDFSDPNNGHTNPPVGNILEWGKWDSYAHCVDVGYSPCPPRLLVPDEHRPRLEEQALTMLQGHRSRSELALGLDASGPPPLFYAWMPDCNHHGGAFDDAQFFTASITFTSPTQTTTETMRSWLEAFMTQGRTDRPKIRMDDGSLNGPTMAVCP